jgi:hypothetical protein
MDRQALWSLIVSWIPFVALIVVWIILSRHMGGRRSPLVRLADQHEEQLAELQRTNVLLDRIVAALERRVEK